MLRSIDYLLLRYTVVVELAQGFRFSWQGSMKSSGITALEKCDEVISEWR